MNANSFFIKENRGIIISMLINVAYGIFISIFVIWNQLAGFVIPGGNNDFQIYYNASKAFFSADPTLIYNSNYFENVLGLQPYRYLLAECFLFYPFTLMNDLLAYFIYKHTRSLI